MPRSIVDGARRQIKQAVVCLTRSGAIRSRPCASALAFAVSLVTSCTTAPQKVVNRAAPAVDDDAPAAETLGRHACAWHGRAHERATEDRSAARRRPVWRAPRAGRLSLGRAGSCARPSFDPAAAPSTSDTPSERVPGVVVVSEGQEAGTDLSWPSALAFAGAGFVAIVPAVHSSDNPFFGEVDDVKAAARALAGEPDVDIDQLYAFGEGRIACQLAPRYPETPSPFRAVGAASPPPTPRRSRGCRRRSGSRARSCPTPPRSPPRLVVFSDYKAALTAHERNHKIELLTSPSAFAAFRALIDKDAGATLRCRCCRGGGLLSSRSAL